MQLRSGVWRDHPNLIGAWIPDHGTGRNSRMSSKAVNRRL